MNPSDAIVHAALKRERAPPMIPPPKCISKSFASQILIPVFQAGWLASTTRCSALAKFESPLTSGCLRSKRVRGLAANRPYSPGRTASSGYGRRATQSTLCKTNAMQLQATNHSWCKPNRTRHYPVPGKCDSTTKRRQTPPTHPPCCKRPWPCCTKPRRGAPPPPSSRPAPSAAARTPRRLPCRT